MTKFSSSRLQELFDNFSRVKIAVVGDLMLDRYMWGYVQRISPEAPVPVVEVTSETVKLGGSANVANNILTIGANAFPVGVVGDDLPGKLLRDLFTAFGMDISGVVTDIDRPTTIKTRIIAHDQHVVRADVESKQDIHRAVEDRILAIIRERTAEIDGIILEDYNKGVLTPRLIGEIITICHQHKIFVAVDPKFNNFFNFRGVDLFKPNMRETEQALGIKINTDEDLLAAAKELFRRLECKYVLITRGDKGMTLFSDHGEKQVHVPTRARKIHDVSGAGDTVISAFVVTTLAGADVMEAATMANFAAAIVCAEVGVVPIDRHKLWEELQTCSTN
ncbi:MAG: D-glycero-beta-D-manno-heptose-7-phosphate kinase [bacterium]|nr:D-glycero-beta-D-manno-heptose-7-phosphate kinase [bacterium]